MNKKKKKNSQSFYHGDRHAKRLSYRYSVPEDAGTLGSTGQKRAQMCASSSGLVSAKPQKRRSSPGREVVLVTGQSPAGQGTPAPSSQRAGSEGQVPSLQPSPHSRATQTGGPVCLVSVLYRSPRSGEQSVRKKCMYTRHGEHCMHALASEPDRRRCR